MKLDIQEILKPYLNRPITEGALENIRMDVEWRIADVFSTNRRNVLRHMFVTVGFIPETAKIVVWLTDLTHTGQMWKECILKS